MVILSSTPKLSAHNEPRIMAMAVLTKVAVRRFIFSSSTMNTMEISLMDMVDVSEASIRRKKNNDDHTTPPGRL